MGGFDLAGPFRIDQRLRSPGARQQDAALLKGLADRRDPEAQGGGIEPLAAGVERGIGDDLLVALVDAAAGKHQRAGVKVDLIMAHHHEDLDFPGGAVAQQQNGRRVARRLGGFGGHSLRSSVSSS